MMPTAIITSNIPKLISQHPVFGFPFAILSFRGIYFITCLTVAAALAGLQLVASLGRLEPS